jgi:hypothetical protein
MGVENVATGMGVLVLLPSGVVVLPLRMTSAPQ